MGPALLILLVLLLFPFFVFVVGAGLLLLFVKPQGIRPPWWDWGIDEPKAKVEPNSEIEEVKAEKESPRVVKSEVAAKPSRPRW